MSAPVVGVGQTPTPVPSDAAATAPQLPVPVAPPLDVDQLVEEAARRLGLTAHRPALTRLMVAYTTYIGGPGMPVQQVALQTALDELDLARGWTQDDLRASCEEIMGALADFLLGLAAEFKAATDTELTGEEILGGVEARYRDELKEQEGGKALAETLLEMIREICGQLGIANPDPALQPLVSQKTAPESALSKAGQAAMRLAGKAVDAILEKPETQAGPAPEVPSWKTPPIVTANDRDVRRVIMVHGRVKAATDMSRIWPLLTNLGLGLTELPVLLGLVARQAREQLTQRLQILDTVNGDNQKYALAIEAVRGLQAIVTSVGDYFFPD